MISRSHDTVSPRTYSWRGGRIRLFPQKDLKRVYWEISGLCNYSCAMCFRHTFDDPPHPALLSKDAFESVIFDLKRQRLLLTMVLGGLGEPMTHPDFPAFVEIAKTSGQRMEISTNGSLIDSSMADFLVRHGVDRITLSAEPGALGHTNSRELAKTLSFLHQSKTKHRTHLPQIDVISVVHAQNLSEIRAFIQALSAETDHQERIITKLILSHLLPFYEEHTQWILYPSSSQLIENLPSRYPNPNRPEVVIPQSMIRTDRNCPFVETDSCVVRSDGRVSPCYHFLHAMSPYVLGRKKAIHPMAFGSIEDQPLLEIWQQPEYHWFRYRVRCGFFPSCPDCPLRDSCSFVDSNEYDCWANSPSCADCLWWRKILICP